MIFCFGSIVALLSLFYSVVATVYSYNLTHRTEIIAMSQSFSGTQCEFLLAAPNDSYIVLNFTQLFGFHERGNDSEYSNVNSSIKTSENCSAKLDILQQVNSTDSAILKTLCEAGSVKIQAPLVFHTNSSRVRLVYQWQRSTTSGFTLYASFRQVKSKCKLDCSGCTESSSRICQERSKACPNGPNCQPDDPSSPTDYIPIFVIVPAVFILGTCVVIYYFVVLRLWREPESHSNSTMERHGQLQTQSSTPTSSCNSRQSTIVYEAGSTADRLQRQLVAVREKPCHRLEPLHQDLVVDLPPHIAISEDGEESYAQYQRLLQRPLNPRDVESVRPPPNKTVYDGESPPSYHSHSTVTLDHETSSSTRLLSRDCNGWTQKGRRQPTNNSLSNLVHSVCNVSRNGRRSRHPSADSTVSHSNDHRPPDYNLVMAGEVGTPPSADLQLLRCSADETPNQQL